MTPAEARLWERLRAHRLNGLHFRRQQVIDGFVVDFYCSSARLIVELDCGVHDLQRDADEERDRILAARGLRVLRFRNEEVRAQLALVLRRIVEIARAPTADPDG
jgi:very-short-patch-repair endonuclease